MLKSKPSTYHLEVGPQLTRQKLQTGLDSSAEFRWHSSVWDSQVQWGTEKRRFAPFSTFWPRDQDDSLHHGPCMSMICWLHSRRFFLPDQSILLRNFHVSRSQRLPLRMDQFCIKGVSKLETPDSSYRIWTKSRTAVETVSSHELWMASSIIKLLCRLFLSTLMGSFL